MVNKYLAGFVILIGLLFCAIAAALEPNEILVIVNKDIPASADLGNTIASGAMSQKKISWPCLSAKLLPIR